MSGWLAHTGTGPWWGFFWRHQTEHASFWIDEVERCEETANICLLLLETVKITDVTLKQFSTLIECIFYLSGDLSRKNYWVNIASFTATYHIIHQSISVYKWVFTQGYLYRTPCTVTHRHSSQYHKNKCSVLSVHCWNTDTLCTFYIDRVTKQHENNGNSSHTHSSHNSSRAHDKFTWSEGCKHGAKVFISPLITVLHS